MAEIHHKRFFTARESGPLRGVERLNALCFNQLTVGAVWQNRCLLLTGIFKGAFHEPHIDYPSSDGC